MSEINFQVTIKLNDDGTVEGAMAGGPTIPLSGFQSAQMFAMLQHCVGRSLANFVSTVKAHAGKDEAEVFAAVVMQELLRLNSANADETYQINFKPVDDTPCKCGHPYKDHKPNSFAGREGLYCHCRNCTGFEVKV